jgi:carboxymethylenebutenolidase
MCDNDSMDDMVKYQLRAGLSRRQFGALSLGAGVVSMAPSIAGAAETKESEIEIKTPDGTCDAHFVHPATGKHPGVLVWPDIFGLRPTFRQMSKRLAEAGYSVLTINPFYRTKKAPTAPENPDFNDPPTRQALMSLAGTLNPATVLTDGTAFLKYLDSQSAVDTKRKVGTTGYCMGGPFTMRTAASFPDRIGAVGSFHGGNLVTQAPDSPHLLVPKMKAQFLIAIAQNDDQRQPEAKDALREAFNKAKLKAEVEVYPAQHGWCPPDSRVYDQAQAEKAWSRLIALFKTALA